MKSDILHVVGSHYLDSGDFNGTPIIRLIREFGVEWNDIRPALQDLIEEDSIGVLFSDLELNTHILRLGFPSKEVQISKLDADDFYHTCVYPRPGYLQKVVDASRYVGEPYKLCLALGEPQLAYRSFDLSVLEMYRNDPRYMYSVDNISGSICVRNEYIESNQICERDQVLLETFGFAYDENLNRAVAAYVRYLADLSPEHQQIWKAKELTGNFRLHPDYYESTVIGTWGNGVSIFSAFMSELYIINRMAAAMGRPPMFKRDYGEYGENMPKKFGFLVRPTLEEFNDFVLLLDKLLADNIDKEFFQDEVSYVSESERKDGKIVVEPKGTLQILDTWIRKYYRTDDWEPWDMSIKAMRDVRKLRQKPAHAIDENIFNQRYFREQKELVIRAYEALRTLRLLLASHPLVRNKSIEIPEWLESGEIRAY